MYAVGARERVLGWIWKQLGLEVLARGGGQKCLELAFIFYTVVLEKLSFGNQQRLVLSG